MFIEKESTEIIELTKEIKVVGLGLQKSGLPISFESLGDLWVRYKADYRDKVNNVKSPIVEYGVCVNTVPDYITGCGVSEISDLREEFTSYVIPTGKYIKDTFNAATFEKLTQEAIMKRNVKAWAEKNNVEINPILIAEVYPTEEFEKGNFEMYTLTPIIE